MIVTPIKTKIVKPNNNLEVIIKNSIREIPENSILVITSKIISICENRIIKKITEDKEEKYKLVRKEADFYLEANQSKYNTMITIKDNFIASSAGIDESNVKNSYVLWPKNPQLSANKIWNFVKKEYNLKNVGVIISDSSSILLNLGAIGKGIVYCGFEPLQSYIDKSDLFERKMKVEKSNLMQSIADAAVLEMGEGNECSPLALVYGFSRKINFIDHEPTEEELNYMKVNIEDDVFYPIFKNADWKKGDGGKL